MPDAPVTDEALVEEIAVALLRARHPRYDHEPDLLWEHWQWFIAGRGNPDSCVHTSTIGEAVRDATAVLAHLRERGMLVPDGWVAVPKEPTEAMRMSLLDQADWGVWLSCKLFHGAELFYAAMLAAAPKPGEGE